MKITTLQQGEAMKITTLLTEAAKVDRMFYFGAADWSMAESKHWFYDTDKDIKVYINKAVSDLEFVERAEGK